LETKKKTLAEKAREYYWKNPEKQRQRKRKEYESNPARSKPKSSTTYHRYGITQADYDRMFEEQGGKCAICGVHQSQQKRRLYVDHDHETNKVRALLCHKCNFMIGWARDNPLILTLATSYVNVFNLWRLVMLPGQPMGNEAVGNPMKPGATEPGDPSPEEIKGQLVGLLKQAKQVAQSNGIDWQEVVSSAEAGAPRAPTGPGMGAAGPVPSPRPPMGSDMGGGMGL
jgi:hypothetical protein